MSPTFPIVSHELTSHCSVTVKAGTNFSPDLPRMDVKTTLSLRFGGAYPLKIKGLKDGEEFVGFELNLTGPDECQQLIRALEYGANELRWQAKLPGDLLLPPEDSPEAIRARAEAHWYHAEMNLLALVLFHGEEPVVGGPTVARFLRNQVQQLPPVATGEAWGRVLSALDQGVTPTLEWLDALGHDGQLVEELRPIDPGTPPDGWQPDSREARVRCEQALTQYLDAGLRVEHLDLLDLLEEENDAEKRRGLFHRARVVEGQRVSLTARLLF